MKKLLYGIQNVGNILKIPCHSVRLEVEPRVEYKREVLVDLSKDNNEVISVEILPLKILAPPTHHKTFLGLANKILY